MGPTTGVVLAAGFGSRLASGDAGKFLKPLTIVAGRPLIARTLESLRTAGCEVVVLVTGHAAEAFETTVRGAYQGPLELRFVHNPRYELKNGVSVLAARPLASGDFLLTMADHVFGREVMELAGQHTPPERGATLLVDRKLDSIFDMDDATKVLDSNGTIVEIGKSLARYSCVDTGLFVCTQGLMDALDKVYRDRGDASLSEGVQALARAGRMTTLDIGDGFWQDVDTLEMLAHAERMLQMRREGGR